MRAIVLAALIVLLIGAAAAGGWAPRFAPGPSVGTTPNLGASPTASPRASPGATPIPATLPVVVANLTCRFALDPGLPAAVEAGTATVAYLRAIGCTPQGGVGFRAGAAVCTTNAAGTCTLHVPAAPEVTVTETRPPAGTTSLVNPLTVLLEPAIGGRAIFVNVPRIGNALPGMHFAVER